VPSRPSTDPVQQYLQQIGRIPLLTAEEELLLARQVQRLVAIEALQGDDGCEPWAERCGLSAAALRLALQSGRRARARMIQGNLRLVVAIAKKHQHRGMELLDLAQEGAMGLKRAVDRFDPTRGFRFSTYAFWWIRQGITRALASQSRTIRMPVHVIDTLTQLRRTQEEQAARQGRLPAMAEICDLLGVEPQWIHTALDAVQRPVSLERRVGREQDSELGDLLEDPRSNPEHGLMLEALKADLEALLQRWLSEREASVIRQRFGLGQQPPRTLSEIGQTMHISRERVRQLEARALGKLRTPYHRCQMGDYLAVLER